MLGLRFELFDWKNAEKGLKVHFLSVDRHQERRDQDHAIVEATEVSQSLHERVDFALVFYLHVRKSEDRWV